MIDPKPIMDLIMPRVGRILDVAEAAFPEPQFKAFRRLALKEFGRDGLEADLHSLERQTKRNG